jgi:hypothetical protein
MLHQFSGYILQPLLKIFVTRRLKICGKAVITLLKDRSLGQTFLYILVCILAIFMEYLIIHVKFYKSFFYIKVCISVTVTLSVYIALVLGVRT